MSLENQFPSEMDRMVYVKPVPVEDLPEDVRAQIGELRSIYAVCNDAGERLALVRDRKVAFILARQNDLEPVNVH